MSEHEEARGTLTDVERDALNVAIDEAETCLCHGDDYGSEHVHNAVERILADRLAAMQAERDEAVRMLAKGGDVPTREHHPNCYQSTGVPDDLPAGLCDCKVLRMLERVEALAEAKQAAGCHYRHQQGETDECNACTAADFAATLDADR